MKVQSHSWKHKIFTWSLFLHRLAAHATNHEVYVTPKYAYKVSTYEPRIATLELTAGEIYRYGVEGNTAELGVYKGRFARQINRFFPDKKLYLFDTFEGFDAKDSEADKAGGFSSGEQDFSRTSVEFVLSRMEHPENCIIRKGWFPDTAQGIDDKFCFVSIDADLYQPILAGLEFLPQTITRRGHDDSRLQQRGLFGGASGSEGILRQEQRRLCMHSRLVRFSCDCAGVVKMPQDMPASVKARD